MHKVFRSVFVLNLAILLGYSLTIHSLPSDGILEWNALSLTMIAIGVHLTFLIFLSIYFYRSRRNIELAKQLILCSSVIALVGFSSCNLFSRGIQNHYKKYDENGHRIDCVLSSPDTSVNGISLWNAESIIRKLQNGAYNNSSLSDSVFEIYSNSGKEKLTLSHAQDRAPGEFSSIEISQCALKDSSLFSNVVYFATNNGVFLGLSRNVAEGRLGSCYDSEKYVDGAWVLSYSLRQDESNYLENKGAKGYYAKYFFQNDAVVRIQFGLKN